MDLNDIKTTDFDYDLPEELIAQTPLKDRKTSRMMVLHIPTGEYEHKHFYDIVDYFHAGDVIVRNNTRVIPARLFGTKEETGAQIIWNAGIVKLVKESSEYQNYDIPVITKRDLQNKLQRKFKRSNDLNNGLKELEERGYVRIFREGKSVKIKINPESFRD